MRVETSLILVSGLFHFVEKWRKPVTDIQPSELILIFHHRGRKLFFRDDVSISNMPAKDKLGGKKKRKKNISQVESFGTKAENLLAGLMEWRISTWKKVMLAKITD